MHHRSCLSERSKFTDCTSCSAQHASSRFLHLFLLTDAVGPGLSLQVVLGVPVGVKYHHGVGRRQVHPQSTCPRRQEETEVQRSLCVEMVNGFLPYVPLDGAVQSLRAESFILVTTFGYLYNHALLDILLELEIPFFLLVSLL